jgi:hypothetical protein
MIASEELDTMPENISSVIAIPFSRCPAAGRPCSGMPP